MVNDSECVEKKVSKQTKSVSFFKVIAIFFVGVLVVGTLCVFTGCFSSAKRTAPPVKISTVNSNNSVIEFREVWNETVSELKYKNIHLKIDFDKYKLGDSPQDDVKRLLTFDTEKYTILNKRLTRQKSEKIYLPIITWIEKKMRTVYTPVSDTLSSDELMKVIASSVTKDKAFSKNTIDIIIQLNDFCYYFERNKEKFYSQGYTKNIKSCHKIEALMTEDGITYKF